MNILLETQKGQIIIRLAAPADAANVRALRLEALRTNPVSFSADLSIEEARGAAWWTERLQEYHREQLAVICLAEAGGELVGMTGLVRGNRPKTEHSAMIWGVYVQPEWRGLRIAQQLIESSLEWARQQGVVVVKLAVVNSNQAAIRAYKRLGFFVYGEDPKAIRYEGLDYDDFLMAKFL